MCGKWPGIQRVKIVGKNGQNWVSVPKIAFTILPLHFTIKVACVVNI